MITLPLWLILIQFVGALVNSQDFAPTYSLKKYLIASHKAEEVDALSFNSFFVILLSVLFFQTLSIFFILTNQLSYILPFYFMMIISTIFLGIYRFRLSLIRREVIEITQITLSQLILISIIVLTWFLVQSDSIILRSIFLLPLCILFYSTELQMIKSGSIYSDKKYLEIKSSYIRLLYQCGFILFVISLILTGSDFSKLIISKFSPGYIHYGALTVLVIVLQVISIILSNIYIKFQPLRDYQSLITSSKKRVLTSFFIFVIFCSLKAFNVF
ncbi:hypothetical protein DAY19_04865 [Halobacteriovorax vibrionivorans]|uniref:Uncharacterized protein n=1 Tax=Halobacteriovorax vibrionivorans TaxID=2152716 RepID=A0ABY0IKT9_9BACT|nr:MULTISPECIES: hypothetical protein [Halobacteriovorax]RZF23105.1 hypothetical protein DAY19_04865 [Halobacteriovorax vibrionivorans]TGD49263.1 hypothetical protein EP118_00215 [Halobacteriovorax sp. Y22]